MGGSDGKPTKTPKKKGTVAGVGSGRDCPSRLTTVVAGPAAGITKGSWLKVRVDRSGGGPRVILVDEVTDITVGSLAGVPNLATLIRCLEDGVPYRALVDDVDGGRIDVTVIQR